MARGKKVQRTNVEKVTDFIKNHPLIATRVGIAAVGLLGTVLGVIKGILVKTKKK